MLTESQALQCADVFNNYFGQFDRIDQYMRDQKLDQISTIPTPLPGFGMQNLFFNSWDMHPSDMDIEIREIPNAQWDTMLNLISSHSNMVSIPGKALKLGVIEKNTNKFVGFVRLGSPVINMKPRNDLLGNVPDLSSFNRTAIMGFVIVPVQPFGYNYLGGKLLAGICSSHFVREKLNKKYNMNLCMLETTSLYGNSKSSSQYDGMKPFIRNRGLTDSNFIPMIHGDTYHKLVSYVEECIGHEIVKKDASSRKLKAVNNIISLINKSLSGGELTRFKETIKNAKNLTEQKRYYVSNYGIRNYIDIVNGKTETIVKEDNFDRYQLENIIDWWKKKAGNRYESLKNDNRIRTELEVWVPGADLDIIR